MPRRASAVVFGLLVAGKVLVGLLLPRTAPADPPVSCVLRPQLNGASALHGPISLFVYDRELEAD